MTPTPELKELSIRQTKRYVFNIMSFWGAYHPYETLESIKTMMALLKERETNFMGVNDKLGAWCKRDEHPHLFHLSLLGLKHLGLINDNGVMNASTLSDKGNLLLRALQLYGTKEVIDYVEPQEPKVV